MDRADLEIRFPQLLGYRIETTGRTITADFSGIEPFEVDTTKNPVETELGTAFSGETRTMTVASAKEVRDQQLVYWITRWVLHFYYSKDDGLADFGLFSQLKADALDTLHPLRAMGKGADLQFVAGLLAQYLEGLDRLSA